jgi:hypothetical protein
MLLIAELYGSDSLLVQTRGTANARSRSIKSVSWAKLGCNNSAFAKQGDPSVNHLFFNSIEGEDEFALHQK